jgi:hypothetical protein
MCKDMTDENPSAVVVNRRDDAILISAQIENRVRRYVIRCRECPFDCVEIREVGRLHQSKPSDQWRFGSRLPLRKFTQHPARNHSHSVSLILEE